MATRARGGWGAGWLVGPGLVGPGLVGPGLVGLGLVVAGCGARTGLEEHRVDASIASDAAVVVRGAPRPAWPLSGSRVTSRRPTLAWLGAASVRVEVCADRACSRLLATIDASTDADSRGVARIPGELPAGPVFWRVRARSGAAVAAEVSATWELWLPRVSHAEDALGDRAWGAVLDVEGDGLADLAITQPSVSLGETGQVFVVHGGREGLRTAATELDVLADDDRGYAGWVMPTDANGDGFSDLVITGAPGPSQLVFGGASGLGESRVFPPLTYPAGDVDGDGYGDLVSLTVGPTSTVVAVYAGSARGPTRADVALEATVDARFDGLEPLDVDGDLRSDWALAAGSAAVLLDPASRRSLVWLPSPDSLAWQRLPVVMGDVNGDGVVDVGAASPAGELVALTLLGAGPDPSREARLVPLTASRFDVPWGDRLVPLADVDGDGLDDLAVGSILGAYVDLYLGAPDVPQYARTWSGEAGTSFGHGLSYASDWNGDGLPDLAIAAPHDRMLAGRVHAFVGTERGPSETVTQTVDGPGPDRFGTSLW